MTVSVTRTGKIAFVEIDNPPVNALSHAVRAALSLTISDLERASDISAVVLSCAGRTFVAGADVKEFGKPAQKPILPEVIDQLEQSTKIWIAAIHGTALGGGLELALGCHYRIAEKDAQFGLPEVTLGLIPGAGGTVRLPRLVPMEDAISIIATGKPVSVERALSIRLIDQAFNDELVVNAGRFAEQVLQAPVPSPLIRRSVIAPLPMDRQDKAIQTTAARARGQLSPSVAVRQVISGSKLAGDTALQEERKTFVELQHSPQSAALRYAFFAERSATKMPELKDTKPKPFDQIAVVGGGTMGAGIATALLVSGLNVTMLERNEDSLKKGLQRVRKLIEATAEHGQMEDGAAEQFQHRLTGTIDDQQLANIPLVIEAVFEDMDVKKELIKRLDEVLAQDAIIASNTSYLDLNQLAAGSINPARIIGLHFFSPAHIMKLVELIQPDHASNEALATGLALGKRLRRIVVPSGVCDGFIGNRIMSAYRQICEYMLEDGALPHEVDRAMKNYGFPMGIFEMQDLAGLDIGYARRQRLRPNRDPGERYVDIADRLVEHGRLGRKSGQGYYLYKDGKTPVPDSWVEELILQEASRKNIARQTISEDTIMQRILDTIQSEGEKLLEEGIAASAEAIDVVMLNGYGFPRWRGGPMYARSQLSQAQ